MFHGNLKTIAKQTLWPILCFAISFTVIFFTQIPDKHIYTLGMTHIWYALATMAIAYIALYISAIWLTARIVTLINGMSMKKNFMRCVVPTISTGMLCEVVRLIMFGSIGKFIGNAMSTMGLSPTTMDILNPLIQIAIVLLLVFLLLPFDYVFTKYLIEGKEPLGKNLGTSYVVGIRHWGFLFIANFIPFIILAVMMSVAMLPLTILLIAHIQNTLGIINGDPDGTFSYFLLIFFLISVISFCITTYISLWKFFVSTYTYGAIATQEAERRKQTETANNHEATEDFIHR